MPTTYAERSMNQLADIGGDLARALGERKRKRDRERLERELLGGDTAETFQLRRLSGDAELSRRLKLAQIERALREPQSRGTGGYSGYRAQTLVDTPYGKMTAAEWAREQRAQAKEQRLLTSPQAGRRGGMSQADKLAAKLNEELIEAVALKMDDVPRLTYQRLLNADDSPYTEEEAKLGVGSAYFAADLPETGGKVRTVRMPQAKFDVLRNQYDGVTRLRQQAPQTGESTAASVYAEMTRPQVADSGEPVTVETKEQRDMLLPGTRYYAPDGSIRVKR